MPSSSFVLRGMAATATNPHTSGYLNTVARNLNPEVYLFWTGDGFSTGDAFTRVSRAAAIVRKRVKHRMFLWDNYPVNDNRPTMHLGPVIDRDPDLCEVVDGYMSNPLCQQNEINRIPLLTCLDYAWNPAAYDPSRSVGQAILHLADTAPQRAVLKDLVEAYPGMLIYGNGNTGFNAVQEQFTRIAAAPHSRQAALAYIEHLQQLSDRLKQAFPGHYQPEQQTLDNDIQSLKKKFATKY